MTIRALIADDEPLAREGLRALLAGEPDVVIVAECADGADAVARIAALRPDLVFLDIQMPELTGFDVMRAIGVDAVPAVIFVTAYDQYALEAFHVHAVDYLLKPANEERFAVAMRRARSLLEYDESRLARSRVASMLTAIEQQTSPRLARLVVRADGRTLVLKPDEIDHIEADGNYARLHMRERTILIRESLTDLEQQLDPARFIRVHRSTILNLDRVREIQTMFKGEHVVLTVNGARFPLSRKYRALLEDRLGKRI
jgi:two-component system, LytTR family, response regulator